MVALACRRGASVLDPAAGEGDLLIWAAGRTGSAAARHGSDRDPAAWRVARVRLLLRGLSADLHLADSLVDDPFTDRRVDAVLVDPPLYGDTTPVEWMRYAVMHLAEAGRAAVAMPARSGPRSALAEALQRREVEAIVLLPASARSDAREPLAVALFAAPSERFDRVLVVDLRRSSRSVWSRQALPLDRALPVDGPPPHRMDRGDAGRLSSGRHELRRGTTPPGREGETSPGALVAGGPRRGRDPGPRRTAAPAPVPGRGPRRAAHQRTAANGEDPASEQLRRALETYLRNTDSP